MALGPAAENGEGTGWKGDAGSWSHPPLKCWCFSRLALMEDVFEVLFVMFLGRALHFLLIQKNKPGSSVRVSVPKLELSNSFHFQRK